MNYLVEIIDYVKGTKIYEMTSPENYIDDIKENMLLSFLGDKVYIVNKIDTTESIVKIYVTRHNAIGTLYSKQKPPVGLEVIGYNEEWIDKFNPTGACIGFVDTNGDFISTYYCEYKERYVNVKANACEENFCSCKQKHITEPEYWTYFPICFN